MWNNIVGGLVVLIVATYIIQFFLPRAARKGSPRTNAQWDIAPVLAFFGVLLLGLSFAEAARQSVVEAWLLGGALGALIGVSLWVANTTRRAVPPPTKREPWWRATIRIFRTFGVVVFVSAVMLYAAVRLFGAAVEVFFASAFGVFVVAIAALVFIAAARSQVAGRQ